MIAVYNILWMYYSFKLIPVYKQPDSFEGECRNETLLCIMMNE
jgi:hypothetical protein